MELKKTKIGGKVAIIIEEIETTTCERCSWHILSSDDRGGYCDLHKNECDNAIEDCRAMCEFAKEFGC